MKLLTQWAVTSSVLILIVLAVRYCFRNKLSARAKYVLWGIVLLRLLVPFQVELPARASEALPVVASNFVPEVADVELYALRTYSRPLSEDNLAEMREHGVNTGTVIGTEAPIHHIGNVEIEGYAHCFVLSDTGVDTYFFYTTLPKFLMTLWVIGTVWVALTIFHANRHFFRRLKYYRHALECAESPVPVYTAANLSSPCLFGVFRPAIYLTPAAAENPEALRHVLAHELVHYAHCDHIWSLLRCVVLALHWYNPLVWLTVLLSKHDGELACDEGAVARLGEAERIPYGRTLVDMVAARSSRPADLLSCSTAMTSRKKFIRQRVARLAQNPKSVRTALFAAAAVAALSVVFVFAGRAQPDHTPDPFLDLLGRTVSLRYAPPMYSSMVYPAPVTDQDLLADAKEILSSFRPLDSSGPQPSLTSADTIHEHRIILNGDEGQTEYSLLQQDGRTYLFPGSIWMDSYTFQEENGETAQLQDVNGTYVAEADVISTLAGLARQQQERNLDPSIPRSISQAELKQYDAEFLRRTGITQLQGLPGSLEDVNFHAGYTTPDTIELWYEGVEGQGDVWVLALSQDGKAFLADQPMEVFNAARAAQEKPAYEQLGPGAFAAFLRPEDVTGVYLSRLQDGAPVYGAQAAVDVEELKALIVQGLYHKSRSAYDEEPYSLCALTILVAEDVGFYLQDGGTDGLILSIGAEPDVVCLRHRILSSPDRLLTQSVYSPELYRTITALASQTAWGNLTAQQIEQANQAFQFHVLLPDGGYGASELSCFFTSSYDDPTQIDLAEFLRYCPLSETLEEDDTEEFLALMAVEKSWFDPDRELTSPLDLPVPVHRYPREKVSALLQKYANVTVEQLDWSNTLYLEEYDAFYNFTSDFGPGFFTCTGGQLDGDTVLLWSDPAGNSGRSELVLQQKNGSWLIQSFHATFPR